MTTSTAGDHRTGTTGITEFGREPWAAVSEIDRFVAELPAVREGSAAGIAVGADLRLGPATAAGATTTPVITVDVAPGTAPARDVTRGDREPTPTRS